MERSEPALVPEWLRVSGGVSGGGNSAHHFASSSSHSDGLSSAHSRNRSSKSVSDKDTSSSSSRRSSSSNGSSKHPYSSFSRSHRDRNRDKEKERSAIGKLWEHEGSDPFGDILISRVEKDMLRRSHSLVYRKAGEVLPRRVVDSKNGVSSNGVLSGGKLVGSTQKTAFEKDFPSLGTGEKQGVRDVGRVSSPVSSTAVQCLPFGNSALIGGEGWTSALAEVPTIISSNSMGPTPVQPSILATSSPGACCPMASLNMAEAVSQAPTRARTTPEVPDKTQRLEELAIKQSKQLIPMTPLMPKGLVLSSDKSKPKTALRTNEVTVASKSVQQQQQPPHSSQLANQSLHGGQVRSETPKSSHAGKFLVLKPVWENGVASTVKDVSSPTNNASRVANSQVTAAPVPPPAPLKSPKSSKLSTIERKVAALSLNSGSTLERRSQAKSRSDFFNLMRKKTSANTSTILSDSGVSVSPSYGEKSGELVEGASAPASSSCVTENGSEVTSNGDTHQREKNEGDKNLSLNGAVYPDEEEAAFLRSLGWEENAGEDDGLTEEEINAFYEEYMKLRPSLKLCRGVEPKLSMLSESHMAGSSRASS